MSSQESSILFPNNSDNNITQEKVIKLLLQTLIGKYSLAKIIEDILNVSKKNEKQLILKNEIPLNSEDIISIIYQNVGSIKLYNCLLEINNQVKIEEDQKMSKIKKEKFLSFSGYKSCSPSKIKEENTNISLFNSHNKNNNKPFNDIVIEIDAFDEGNINKNDNNIISLSENETSVYEIKEGLKSEKKNTKRKKKNPKIKTRKMHIHNNGFNSELKRVNVNKKLGNCNENKYGCHYTLDKGIFHKYEFKCIDINKDIAHFICCEPNCKATGKYNIKSKCFNLITEHDKIEHNYNKNMVPKDMNILKYMKENNIENMQLTKA